ncbi:MAG: hypothetical protein RIS88_68 [Pseudomonadota bacterium]|jgi:type IV fimbrial biogenesis protein FimT
MPRRRPPSGLTLIELLIGIALLAALMALAAPSLRAQIAQSQLTAATNALFSSLMQARAQAIRLGRRVTLCRTHDQQQCDTDNARGWESGWLVFIDNDRSGGTQASVSASDTLLSRHEPLPSTLRARGNSQVDTFISFGASGEARTMGGGTNPLGTLRVCSLSGALADTARERQLVLAAGGRIVSRPAPAAVNATCA